MRENDNLNIENENKEGGFDFRAILGYLRAYWWMFVLSVIVCLAGAYVYLRCATPVYNISAKVLLQDSEKGGSVLSPSDMLVDFGMQSQTSNVENEIEVMSSMTVVRTAVIDAGLYMTYQSGGTRLYKSTTPLVVSLGDEALASLSADLNLEMEVGENGEINVSYDYNGANGNYAVNELPFSFGTPVGEVVISRNQKVELLEGAIAVVVKPVDAVA